MDLMEIKLKGVDDWARLAQDMDRWWGLVGTVIHSLSIKAGNFLNS
jgi:hypothetical protein